MTQLPEPEHAKGTTTTAVQSQLASTSNEHVASPAAGMFCAHGGGAGCEKVHVGIAASAFAAGVAENTPSTQTKTSATGSESRHNL